MWTYRNPVDIRFGQGSFSRLGALVAGRKYALVTYGEAFSRALGEQLAADAGSPIITIDDIEPNPRIGLLAQQTARFAELGARPDVVVAIGGGSVIDSAKVYAAAAGNFDLISAYLKHGAKPDTLHPVPVIAVPTTAGTGSEVTSWGTVWDDKGSSKYSLAHPELYPQYAVVDPLLMVGKPRALTVQTGLDALSHALESLWNRNANPVSLSHAVMAARSVLATLPALVNDLSNIALRERMAQAALHAGLAFSNTKTAIAHSLSYPVTLKYGVPHGIACSFSLPMVMRSVSGTNGICREGLDAIFGDAPEAAASRLTEQLEALGVATDPKSYGIGADEWMSLIDAAFDGERGQNFIGTRADLLAVAQAGAR